MSVNVSRETVDRLKIFEAEFRKWSFRINLASPSTMAEFETRHIRDSLQLREIAPDALHWVDLGTGGGLPGMVIAAVMEEVGDSRVDLVESNRKKTGFLQAIRPRVAPSVHIHPERIEVALPDIPKPAIVTARALASLDDLLQMTQDWLGSETRALFQKGRGYRQEIEDSRKNWTYDLTIHPSEVDDESVILEIANLAAL